MGVSQLNRDRVVGLVMKSLARISAREDVLPVRDERGVARIVVTLPTDRVGDVAAQLRELGGSANVILAEDRGFLVIAWKRTETDRRDSFVDVHPDATMGMLRAWLEQQHDRETNVRLVLSNHHSAELAYQPQS